MNNSKQLKEFREKYQSYIQNVLEPTQQELKALLKRWREPDYWSNYIQKKRLPSPSPVQRFRIRIKRPESVVDKIIRRPKEFPDGLSSASFRSMNDALGARIMVYFVSQLPLIDREIRVMDKIELSQDELPIAYLSQELVSRYKLDHLSRKDKESGYASIHYRIRLTQSEVPKEQRPWIELQIRTLTEDTWAEIEHLLGYKPDKKTSFAVKRQFQILSRQLESIDEHFNFLFEELSRFQEEVLIRDSDPLNAENFPAVMSELGISCAQREVDSLLKILVSRSIFRVGELRQCASPDRHEIVMEVYKKIKKRQPNSFELIANFANLGISRKDVAEDKKLIEAQIAFLDGWDELKERRK